MASGFDCLTDCRCSDGSPITIGLRPEYLKLTDQSGVAAEVEVVEPLGMSTQFYARLAGEQICVYAIGRANVAAGDNIQLTIDPLLLHVFDPTSGARFADPAAMKS